ncbi:Putative ribonuclease H protein At1g65750 [Linum perenne]
MAVVLLINGVDNLEHRHASLVEQFHSLRDRDWEVTIHHIYHEANNVADYLANLGQELDIGTHVFLNPDTTLLYLLRYDLIVICLPRIINNTS